jgi:hypothetical protein
MRVQRATFIAVVTETPQDPGAVMNEQERIAKLEDQVRKLNEKGKDHWDRFGVLASALIPLAIAAVGWKYSNASTETAELRAAAESKLKQAELVSKFFDPLTGADEIKRQFAVDSLLVAAPDYGPVLVRVLADRTDAPKDAEYARNKLDERRDALIRQLFSDTPSQRVRAYEQLLESWASDVTLVDALTAYGSAHKSNGDGIYNSLVLLSHMQRDTIQKKRDEITRFVDEVENSGPKIRDRAATLRSRVAAQENLEPRQR